MPPAWCDQRLAVRLWHSLTATTGTLPQAWAALEPRHLVTALELLDPTHSGMIESRQLLTALAGAALHSVHTATPAVIAAQAAALAAGDADGDGCLTRTEFESVSWWFEPRQEALRSAQDVLQAAGNHGDESAATLLREGDWCVWDGAVCVCVWDWG
jgi:Ca2+-binding EF-hand superfamily protein